MSPAPVIRREREKHMMNAELLKKAGIEYARGVERYLNDAEMYEMLLCDFCADDQLPRSQAAFAQRDGGLLLSVAHEVKGTASNLDMERLFGAASALVTALRDAKPDWNDLDSLFEEYENAFTEAKEAVAKAAGNA